MCIPIRERSRKQRGLIAIANLALCLGVALPYGFRPTGLNPHWLDAARGLLFGVSIGTNLMILRFGKRTRVVNKTS
jgi:hypothetical protein